jgi:Anthrone oxygenase
MPITVVTFLSVVLSALLMGTSLAHALEMPAKMNASAAQWLTLQQTLYRSFATIGGSIEIGAFALVGALAFLVRSNRPALWVTLSAVMLLGIAFFIVWLGFTKPVNARTATWTPDTIPPNWTRWRTQWEYSHVVRFVLHLLAFCALLTVLMRTSRLAGPTD